MQTATQYFTRPPPFPPNVLMNESLLNARPKVFDIYPVPLGIFVHRVFDGDDQTTQHDHNQHKIIKMGKANDAMAKTTKAVERNLS